MGTDITVLLVDPAELPPGLEEQLSSRGAFVETTTSGELEPAVVAVAPDLVLATASESLTTLLEILGRQNPVTQLALLADWRAHRELRARRARPLGALLSKDMPVGVLAARVVDLAQKAARGQPLQRTLYPPASETAGAAPTTGAARAASAAQTPAAARMAGLAAGMTTPLDPARRGEASVPTQHAPRHPTLLGLVQPRVPQITSEPTQTLQAEPAPQAKTTFASQATRGTPAARDTVTARGTQTSLRGTTSASAAQAKESKVATAPQQTASTRAKTDAPEAPDAPIVPLRSAAIVGSVDAPESPCASEVEPQPAPQPAPQPLRPAPEPETELLREPDTRASRPTSEPETLRETEPQPSEPQPEPETLREPEPAQTASVPSEHLVLTLSRRPLPPLRLALVDTDLTRAGALGDELRARGAVLQLVAPEVDATRWHLLRRLSPHALILDERALGTHATWLERVRRDPYLGHVPLLPAPLDRLFLENSGRVDLSPLIPLLLSLGAEELALRDQLRPGRSVEIRLDQLGPSRLLEVLSAHPRPCTAVCSAGSTRLEWSFATGQALGAQLETPGRGVESVSPEGALEWLLAHPDCRVCVSEGASLPGSAESNTSTEVLLTDSTTGEALPSSPPPPMPSAASGASASSSRRSARAPAAPLPSGHGHGVTQRLRTQAEAVPPLLRARAAALKSRWGALPSRTRSGALVGAGLIATVLVGLAVSGGSAEADTTAQVTAARPPDPDPGMKDGSEPARPPTDDAQALTSTEGAPPFQVAPDAQLPPCPPPEASPQNVATGSTALQKARQRLVAGDVEGARALMCQAAQLEPSGSAAESLALLFLSGRSLDNAKHWAEAALRQDPERRTARELLGDIENQRGNIEASREIWLSTMQLRGDEIARIDAVSRQQVREGLVAVKSRDLPRAERYFRRAITLQPKNGAAAAALAQVLVQLGYREAALAWARHAVSLDPGTRVSLAADFAELAPG